VIPRPLNWLLAWIATAIGVAEALSWLPRSALITLGVIVVAVATWAILHRFSIPMRRIDTDAIDRRRKLGY
jgi:4-hydroxybenzoate polyprenyltransferase